MATELHLAHNPAYGIKRHIRGLKSSTDANEALMREVIESNVCTQQAVADVSKSLNEFVALLKSAGGEEPKQARVEIPKVPAVEQKLDKIAMQNLQLIQVISELVKHLRKDKSAPQQTQQYTGIYPMRPAQ